MDHIFNPNSTPEQIIEGMKSPESKPLKGYTQKQQNVFSNFKTVKNNQFWRSHHSIKQPRGQNH